jgi:hypothetical protein
MKGRHFVLVAGALAAAAVVLAQQESSRKPVRHDSSKVQKSEPVIEHRNLEPFVGTWQVTGQCYEKDESAPQAFSGTLTSEWALDNHFVKSHLKGKQGNDSFEGIGFCGYDPAKSKYVSSWHNNQCNSILLDEGAYEQGSKEFSYVSEMAGPDGQTMKCRRVVKIVSNDEHTMTFFATEGGKAERKMSEMTFRRTGRTARADGTNQP